MSELHAAAAGEDLTDEALVEQVLARLSTVYEDVDAGELTRRVAEALASLVGPPLRHFLPGVVERNVVAQLR